MDGQCNDGRRADTMSKLTLALTTGRGESAAAPSNSIARLSAKGSGGYGQASLREKADSSMERLRYHCFL